MSVQFCLVGDTRRAPPQHRKNARVYGQTTVMQTIITPPHTIIAVTPQPHEQKNAFLGGRFPT